MVPDSLYSLYHFSHPPLVERLAAIKLSSGTKSGVSRKGKATKGNIILVHLFVQTLSFGFMCELGDDTSWRVVEPKHSHNTRSHGPVDGKKQD